MVSFAPHGALEEAPMWGSRRTDQYRHFRHFSVIAKKAGYDASKQALQCGEICCSRGLLVAARTKMLYVGYNGDMVVYGGLSSPGCFPVMLW